MNVKTKQTKEMKRCLFIFISLTVITCYPIDSAPFVAECNFENFVEFLAFDIMYYVRSALPEPAEFPSTESPPEVSTTSESDSELSPATYVKIIIDKVYSFALHANILEQNELYPAYFLIKSYWYYFLIDSTSMHLIEGT